MDLRWRELTQHSHCGPIHRAHFAKRDRPFDRWLLHLKHAAVSCGTPFFDLALAARLAARGGAGGCEDDGRRDTEARVAAQLAAHFNMSKQGMSAGLKKRDAVKGCRAFETLGELNLQISRNQLARELAKDVLWQKAMERHAIFTEFLKATLIQGGIDPVEITASGLFSVLPQTSDLNRTCSQSVR